MAKLLTDLVQVLARDRVDLSTRSLTVLGEVEQASHRIEREAEVAALPDKDETMHICLAVKAVTAFAACRLSKQADALVVADRRNLAACPGGELANREWWREWWLWQWWNPLEPLVTRGSIIPPWPRQ